MNRCLVQNKRKFADRKTAIEFVWHFEIDFRLHCDTRNWHVYKCKHCKSWHLTEQSKWRILPDVKNIDTVKERKFQQIIAQRKSKKTIIDTAYKMMYWQLGIKPPKPPMTTLKGTLPLEQQRRILQSLTASQSTGKT